MSVTEVIVVGAGPAGSIAALLLARAGVNVRLLDRASFPRNKLCGDTLNPGALSILQRLGIADAARHGSLAIPGMTVTGPGGASVTANYPDDLCGIALTRRELDYRLLEAATSAGATFEPGVSVRAPLFTAGGLRVGGVRAADGGAEYALPASIVIAADGRHSRLAFSLGLSGFASTPKRWAFGAYFTGVDDMTAYGEMHIRPDGYIGIAPLPGDIINVCVVRELKAGATLASAIAADPALKPRFARARQLSTVTALGPLAIESHGVGCPGLVIAGDAAGFIDPMTGDGLRFALRGGELAAEAVLNELESAVPAWETLRAARAREFAGKWRINRVLRRLVGSPRALDLVAKVATHWSAPFQYLINVAGDVNLALALRNRV